ncbi:MAG: hypothetical protein JST79_08845 [Acidobacteria bacterium]|nr:hypothetical protein [Acidobacteriota bacterium]
MMPGLKAEAKARQGQRTDLTSAPFGAQVSDDEAPKKARRSSEVAAEAVGVSRRTIERAIAKDKPKKPDAGKKARKNVARIDPKP